MYSSAAYDFFISIEVLIRIKNNSIGRNFRNRGITYHILSNLSGIISATVSAEVLLAHPSNRTGFETDSAFSWYYFTLPIVYLIFTIGIIAISVHYVLTHDSSPRTRFLKYTNIYLSVFAGFRLLPFILVNFLAAEVEFEDNPGITFLLLIWYSSGSAVFLARLYEPTIRYYIKDCIKTIYRRIRQLHRSSQIKNMNHLNSTGSSNTNSLLAIRIFDEVKLEIFESISMAVSIIMFKYTDPDSSLPLEIQ